MRRDFAAFRVFRRPLRKLETRKVTRKVANLRTEFCADPRPKRRNVSHFGVSVPRKKRFTTALKASAERGRDRGEGVGARVWGARVWGAAVQHGADRSASSGARRSLEIARGRRTPRGTATTFGEEFGERLKAKREERGFTLEELAENAGMHSGRLSEYQSGRHTPQLEKAAKLAKVLEVSLDELVGLKPPEVCARTCAIRGCAQACAVGHSRYIEAAGLAVEEFVALARHEQFEAVRPRRRK